MGKKLIPDEYPRECDERNELRKKNDSVKNALERLNQERTSENVKFNREDLTLDLFIGEEKTLYGIEYLPDFSHAAYLCDRIFILRYDKHFMEYIQDFLHEFEKAFLTVFQCNFYSHKDKYWDWQNGKLYDLYDKREVFPRIAKLRDKDKMKRTK